MTINIYYTSLCITCQIPIYMSNYKLFASLYIIVCTIQSIIISSHSIKSISFKCYALIYNHQLTRPAGLHIKLYYFKSHTNDP